MIDFSLQNALVLYCLVNPTDNILEHVSFMSQWNIMSVVASDLLILYVLFEEA